MRNALRYDAARCARRAALMASWSAEAMRQRFDCSGFGRRCGGRPEGIQRTVEICVSFHNYGLGESSSDATPARPRARLAAVMKAKASIASKALLPLPARA